MPNPNGVAVNTPAGSFPSLAAAWRATKDHVPYPPSSSKLVLRRREKGWTVEQCLGFAPPKRRGRPKPITVGGVTYPSRRDAAKALGVDYADIHNRLRRGWTPEEAYGLVKRKTTPMKCPSGKSLAKHGLTEDDWAHLWLAQGGACAICGTKESNQWHIDHDHSKGYCKEAVRGVLCGRCNHGLGLFREDASYMRSAAAYIEKHSS